MEKLTIYSYTIMRSSTADFIDKIPYVTAMLIKNGDESKYIPALVEGYTEGMEIKIGMEVKHTGVNANGFDTYSF